jgi:riboflavin transporter 2
MSYFGNQYIPAYFLGTALSGFIPSGLGVIQGTSSYTCKLSLETNEMKPEFEDPRFSVSTFYAIIFVWACGSVASFYILDKYFKRKESIVIEKQIATSEIRGLLGSHDLCLLVSIGLVSAQLNTLLPSIQSYASLSYSQNTYFWAIFLSTVSKPISAFIAGIFPLRKLSTILVLVLLCTTATLLIVFTAFQSPDPWMKNSIFGSIISVRKVLLINIHTFR